MSRQTIILSDPRDRMKAANFCMTAPAGSRAELKAAKRSIPQNARMWAMLTAIANQVDWHGVTLSPDDWKLIFLDALRHELRVVPNLDGTGLVHLGRSSSDLSVAEMVDLQTLIERFAAERGVVFHWEPPL